MPAAIPNRIATQIRVDKTIYQKTKTIAKLESRNTNSQIEYFIRKGVEAYEKENTAIVIPEDE
ncbi:MAG: hypothetical protein OSJ45_03915 [Lachnospiraceae bacterium]|nr:hypothetical protein [Lachnospiraceae bacterium]